MKRKVTLLRMNFLILFLCAIPILYASPTHEEQAIIIKGRVIDTQKESIPGVNVSVKGTTIGTITDLDGRYQISVPNQKAILVFSFVGYTNQEIPVGKKTVLNITLMDDTQNLEEVVVVAYGTKSKASITGALSSVNTKELLQKAPVASISNVLAGALPGVASVQSTGQPGRDAATIYVRGAGSLSNAASKPLILVDGVERDFSQIDPNEIESLSVLKDASSTAVFGVRGANGVVLITTRRGTKGRPTINVSTSLGLQQPISLAHQTSSYEYARFWNMKQDADNVPNKALYFTPEQIEAYRTGSDPILYPNVDWGNYMFNKVFLQSKNNINISGGSDNVKYFISLGYLYQNGILKQFDTLPYDNNYRYDRYNYRANIDVNLTHTTTMKLGVGGTIGKQREPRTVEGGNPWVYAQIWATPFSGPGIINGHRTLVPKEMVPLGGEIVRDGLSTFYGYGYNVLNKTTLNMDLDITQKLDFLTKGLSISVKAAYDNKFDLNKYRSGGGSEIQRVYYQSFLDDATKPQTDPDYDKTHIFVPEGQDGPLNYSEGYGRDRNWYLEARINYDQSFGLHKVSGLVLYNQSRDYYPLNPDGGAASYQYIPRGYVGLVGRATYSYATKYLLDANVGYNGSENFAKGKTRFGLFPSVSAGWVMSAEKFMEKQHVIDYLKFRASWGKVGSDVGNSTRFMYMPGTWTQSSEYSFGVNNSAGTPSYAYGTPGNPDVSWETAAKQNYGIDMKFLGGRLSANVDYFIEHREGILITPNSTPSIIATSLPNLNIGKVDNKGYEIVLGWDDTVNDWHYYVNANMSYARNKIIYMDEVPGKYSYMDQTGGPTGRQKGVYKYIRLYQYDDFNEGPNGELVLKPELPQPYVKVYPGDAMYADLNGNGVVDGDDKMTTGYSNRPEYVFGVNAGFNWKGFDFSMQWSGATHVNKMLEIEYRIPYTNAGTRGLLDYFYERCWTPENQQGASLPRAAETSESWNSESSTLWLRNSSYVRLKSINLGYTFRNKPILKKLGINSLGITFSGYNLLTFSPLKIIDPEAVTTNTGDYPLTKLYSFGVNLNF